VLTIRVIINFVIFYQSKEQKVNSWPNEGYFYSGGELSVLSRQVTVILRKTC